MKKVAKQWKVRTWKCWRDLAWRTSCSLREGSPTQSRPTLSNDSPNAVFVPPRLLRDESEWFFDTKPHLFPFNFCECTLCGRLPVPACSATRAHACHLLGRDMKPWTVPACEQATVEEAAFPNKTLTSLISFKSSQGTSLFSSPCSKKNQYRTVGEQKPVTAPAGPGT